MVFEAALAIQAMREAEGGVLSIGEIEQWIRRVYPAIRAAMPVTAAAKEREDVCCELWC